MKLKDKLILITGASRGIGAETAVVMGAKDNTVILLARREENLRTVAEQVRRSGGAACYYPLDLSDPKQVERVSEKIKKDEGIPDIIINNAGAGKWLDILETTPEQAQQMMGVPYLAAFYVTQAFVAEMKARGSGHIVNLTSDASFLPKGNAIAYSAARYALRGFSEALRADLSDTGVKVSLAVFGKVASTYWENNPGSEKRIPAPTPFMPTLTTTQAAHYLMDMIENDRRILIQPGIFRLLFWAFRNWPDAMAARMKIRN
jgi:short-subunit dehydrogenase